jgi:hypothetical protein
MGEVDRVNTSSTRIVVVLLSVVSTSVHSIKYCTRLSSRIISVVAFSRIGIDIAPQLVTQKR